MSCNAGYKNIFFIMLLVLFFSGCGSASEKNNGISAEESAALGKEMEDASEEMLSSFSVSGYSKGGDKQWDLSGNSADIMCEEIALVDVTGNVYGKETSMTVVADKGTLNRMDNNVQLQDNVLATAKDGSTLATDYLSWDAQSQLLSSDDYVEIKKGMLQATGTGIVAQPVVNSVELKKDVTVNITLDKLQTDGSSASAGEDDTLSTVITCDGPLEVDYQASIAVFQNHVVAIDSRGKIIADKMQVYFSSSDKDNTEDKGMGGMGIDKLIAEGAVEIYHGDNTTYSQKAVYDARTGKVTLTGQPKLVIYSMEDFAEMMK